MPVFAVHYTYDKREDVRDVHRPAHRAFLQVLEDQGAVLARGPYVDVENPGALIIVRAENADAAIALVDPDPFNTQGLIADRQVREWTQVGGPWVD